MSDTLDEINCPACGEKMEKIYLEEQKFNIDICLNGCGGIFLDNREYKKIDEQHENIKEILEAIKGKTFKKVSEEQIRTCPVCGHKMVKNYTSHLRNIEIDECYTCGGKFFDHGELIKTRDEYKTEKDRIEAFNSFVEDKYGEKIKNAAPKTKAIGLANVFSRVIEIATEEKSEKYDI